jgi:hypothetical protein
VFKINYALIKYELYDIIRSEKKHYSRKMLLKMAHNLVGKQISRLILAEERKGRKVGKISFNSYTGEYDGYNSEGDLITIKEDIYVEEFNDVVNSLVGKGYDVKDAETYATFFLSNPAEWPLEN